MSMLTLFAEQTRLGNRSLLQRRGDSDWRARQVYDLGDEELKGNERPTSMMTALVLICSLAKAPFAMDCGTDNAVDVLKLPGEYYSLATCFTRVQAVLAESRYELAVGLYPKIVCRKPHRPANVG